MLAKNSPVMACEGSWRSLIEGGKEFPLLKLVYSHHR